MKQSPINILLLLFLFTINKIYAGEEQRTPRPPFPIPSQEAQDQEQLFPRPEGNIFQESIFVEGNIIIQNNNNDANMYCLIFQKSRLGGKVQNNDEIGCIEFEGHDGFQNGAAIRSHVDGTPSTGIVPGRIEFYTEPTTQGTAFERMRITGTGFIGIGTQAPFAELQLDNTSFGFSVQQRSITPGGVGDITIGTGLPLFVNGQYAYLIGTNYKLAIFDISNPNNPLAMGTIGTGDDPFGIFVQDNLAYVVNFSSNNFQIFNVSNPNSIVLESTTSTGFVSLPAAIFVRGYYAFIITGNTPPNGGNLLIYNISNPASPVLLSTTAVPGAFELKSLFVENNIVYIANVPSSGPPGTLQAFNITNPSLPVFLGEIATSGILDSSIFVKNNLVYAAEYSPNFFEIYDFTNPTTPVLLSSIALSGSGQSVFVYDNYAYVSTGFGLNIFDVSLPSAPFLVAHSTILLPLFVSGNFIYSTDLETNSNLVIANTPISLYAHKNASLLGNVEVNSIFNVARGLLYADGTTNQVGINTPFPGATLDVNGDARISQDLLVTNSVNIFGPVAINNNNAIPYDILKNNSIAGGVGTINPGSFVSGNYAYLTGTLDTINIFNISNPNNIVGPVGTISTGPGFSPNTISVQNNILYYVDEPSGTLTIYNVSNPSTPTFISTTPLIFNLLTWIFVRGNYAYITTTTDTEALLIYNISNPSAPTLVSTTSITGFVATRVFVENNIAYVSNSTVTAHNLQAWNVENPSSPVFLGAVSTGFSIDSIFVKNGLVYLVETASPGNFNIYDFTSPTTPSLVSSTLLSNTPRNVIVYDNYACISLLSGLSIYDVTIPATPTLVTTSSLIFPFFVSGNYIYGSNSSTGTNLVIASGPIALIARKNAQLIGNVEVNSVFNVARGTLYADGTTQQVGINTAFPGATLDVNGNALVATDVVVGNNLTAGGTGAFGQNLTFNTLGVNTTGLPLSTVGTLQVGPIRSTYGTVSTGGSPINGGSLDWSVTNQGPGLYQITFNPAYVTNVPMVVTLINEFNPTSPPSSPLFIQTISSTVSKTGFQVQTYLDSGGFAISTNIGFTFFTIGSY